MSSDWQNWNELSYADLPGIIRLLDKREVCFAFGGLHPSTLYRHIRNGRIPRPIKVGGSSRWVRSEVEAALQAIVDRRVS